MFIITHKPELSIWLTETPFKKTSGTWCFYDTPEEYDEDLYHFKKKYGSKFIMTLKRVQQLYKERGMSDTEDED